MANFMSTKETLTMGRWIDFSTYTKFEVSFTARDHHVGVSRADLPKLRFWLLDNMKGDVVYGKNDTRVYGDGYFIFLSDEEDAVLFKLSKWYCGELNVKMY